MWAPSARTGSAEIRRVGKNQPARRRKNVDTTGPGWNGLWPTRPRAHYYFRKQAGAGLGGVLGDRAGYEETQPEAAYLKVLFSNP